MYVHIFKFHLYRGVNIYANWLHEQFCNLSLYTLYTLYIHRAINLFKKNEHKYTHWLNVKVALVETRFISTVYVRAQESVELKFVIRIKKS
jgi:hypothetical protein